MDGNSNRECLVTKTSWLYVGDRLSWLLHGTKCNIISKSHSSEYSIVLRSESSRIIKYTIAIIRANEVLFLLNTKGRFEMTVMSKCLVAGCWLDENSFQTHPRVTLATSNYLALLWFGKQDTVEIQKYLKRRLFDHDQRPTTTHTFSINLSGFHDDDNDDDDDNRAHWWFLLTYHQHTLLSQSRLVFVL
jgi:hypothetical protein